jgi:hypothetical protein
MGLRTLIRRYCNELDGNGGDLGGGGEESSFDMEAAVSSIGSELGFDLEENKDDRTDDVADLAARESGTGAPAPAPSPAPAPAPTAAPAPAPAPAPTAAPAAGPVAPPRFTKEAAPTTWTPAAAAQWAALPEAVREEIARRESNMFQGLETYKADAGFAKEVRGMLAPVQQALVENNVTPTKFVGNLVNAHLALSSNQFSAEQKREMAMGLLKSYGIEVGPAKAAADDGTFIDPTVKALQDEVQRPQ